VARWSRTTGDRIAKKGNSRPTPLVGPRSQADGRGVNRTGRHLLGGAPWRPSRRRAQGPCPSVVAARGTRLDTQVGLKGSARSRRAPSAIAMATGLRSSRSCIRNSDSCRAQRGPRSNPARCDVTVLPPSGTADLDRSGLPERSKRSASRTALLAECARPWGRRREPRRVATWPALAGQPAPWCYPGPWSPTEARWISGSGSRRPAGARCRRFSLGGRRGAGPGRVTGRRRGRPAGSGASPRGLPEEHGACAWPGWPTGGPDTTRTSPANGSRADSWRATGGGAGWCWPGARHARSRQRWARHRRRRLRRLTWARAATLALDRAEYGCAGGGTPGTRREPAVKDEILFLTPVRNGLRAVRRGPGSEVPFADEAAEILDELAAGWSRRLHRRHCRHRPADLPSAASTRRSTTTSPSGNGVRAAMERHPHLLVVGTGQPGTRSCFAAAMQELGLPPAHCFAGSNMGVRPMGALERRAGPYLHPALASDGPACTSTCLREYVRVRAREAVHLSWSIEGPGRGRGRRCRRGSACCLTPPTSTCPGGLGRHRAAAVSITLRPAARDLRMYDKHYDPGATAGRLRGT